MMSVRQRGRILAHVLVATLLGPAIASAQTSLQIPLQFDFINPGAKSLALGGAFAGVADDATASFANPAGLTQLTASELSLEMRATRTTSRFLQRGRLSGDVTNELTDTIQGPIFGDAPGSHVGLGYFSLAYLSKSRRWVASTYRHELARANQTFLAEGVFQQDPTEFVSRRDSPQQGVQKVSITGYGASAAYNITPYVTVGAALSVYSFDLDSVFRRFDTDGFLGPPVLTREFGRSTQQGSAFGIAPTVGLVIRNGQSRFGVVYRRGATFDFDTVDGSEPARPGSFRVPNTVGAGVSTRVGTTLVSAEITHVTYSRLIEDFVTSQATSTNSQQSFSIDDATEFHVSVQYRVARKDKVKDLDKSPILVRAGMWYDPDHSVHFTPIAGVTTPTDRLFNERLAAALSQGTNRVHGTAGVGLTLPRRAELNVGVDFAARSRVFSTSLIVHLDRKAKP